ncbi:MAG: pyridoxamine 5'-phosphate oxidase family protein [Fibrobacter sp.]|nr:pyridoxamine 5'-phosphate oxidase family protein [Fibrobacter sp.]
MLNTSLCYIEQNGSYLLLHRVKKKNDINHDKWIGIGGKFEEGESPEDCIRREAREETGLELNDLKYCGIVTFISDGMNEVEFMHLFKATQFTGKIKECDEGVLEWISKEKFAELPHWDGDRIFLTLMDREVPFFSLKLTYKGDVLTEALLNEKPVDHRDFAFGSLAEFPPMRRKDREMQTEAAAEILTTGEYGILSTQNSLGYPYGIPINYAFDGKDIWIHGAKDAGEKAKDFARDSKVSFTVVRGTKLHPEAFSTAYESCIAFGRIFPAEDPRTGLRLLVDKYSPEHKDAGDAFIDRMISHVSVYRIHIEHLSGKKHL